MARLGGGLTAVEAPRYEQFSTLLQRMSTTPIEIVEIAGNDDIFVTLLAPIMWASHTLFLARLLLGRTVGWGAQARDDHAVPWSHALRAFWPQTLIGLAPVLPTA